MPLNTLTLNLFFQEVLSKIGDAHPGSKLNQNKSIRDIKTKEVVKKHIALQKKK